MGVHSLAINGITRRVIVADITESKERFVAEIVLELAEGENKEHIKALTNGSLIIETENFVLSGVHFDMADLEITEGDLHIRFSEFHEKWAVCIVCIEYGA